MEIGRSTRPNELLIVWQELSPVQRRFVESQKLDAAFENMPQ